ncbi:hypothetical protein [Bacteroides oleiciplenus]|uniref:Lipoprotein n=1 Tax=Bacteroides oleiciplenus TaxID=626931 RepID=A0A3E5BHY7_9BACE|nr:hypothetical protein [Bacteroides oleiciplenus]RGN37221.1 hypothetical protein DXB65_06860 [Bacteroides oleiciplenus]
MKNIGKCKKWRILACIGILSMLFACADHMLQDDVSPTAKRSRNRNKELTASVAKEWFESNYTPVVMTRTSNEEGKELTVKPCWDKAKESNRGRFEVVETPTLSRGMHVILDEETAQHWQPGMKADYIRNTTKMVVLKDMVTNKTRSFIMIFVGSYDYLMRTRNMGRNSYLYREPDYDGLVFYYAINGTFINGWRYSNGKLVGYISSSNKEQQAESFASTRGHQECHDVYTTEYRQDCHDEYELVGGDMETGLIYDIVRYCDYIPYTTSYQDCHYVEDGSEDNNNNNDGWWNDPYPPGGESGGSSSQTSNIDKIYGKNSTLSVTDKRLLESAIIKMNKSPIFKNLFDVLKDKTKIDFNIKSDISASAQFRTDNSISFKSSDNIDAGALREEMVHALQYNSFYHDNMKNLTYKFNIELEAHIFVDAALTLMNNKFYSIESNTIGFGGTEALKNSVVALMNSILEDGSFSDKQLPLYQEVAKNWNQYSGSYINSFPPKALYQYIKK